jgi:hypothetical protein
MLVRAFKILTQAITVLLLLEANVEILPQLLLRAYHAALPIFVQRIESHWL